MSDINLIQLGKLPRTSLLKNEDLIYLTSNNVPLSTTVGGFINQIKQSIAFEFLPTASLGDGLIYEGNQWNSRRLTYADLDGVPIQSPFNYNIDVTYTETSNVLRINPDSITQSYVIGDVTYSITNTQIYNIPSLLDPGKERIDYVILKENGVIEYRKGVESQVALTPGIAGNELILLQLLVSSGSSIISENNNTNLTFTNGISISGSTVSLGGSLTSNTSIGVGGFSLGVGGTTFSTDTSISNLSLTGLVKDNTGNLPSTDGHALVYQGGQLIWTASSDPDVGFLRTLTGTTTGTTDLGAFTGAVLTDNTTIKVALQEVADFAEAITGATDLTVVNRLSTTLDIQSSTATGADATIPEATTTLAGLMTGADKTKSDFLTLTGSVNLDTVNSNLSALVSLSGQVAGTTDFGTIFTGSTIGNSATISSALQDLETSLETNIGDLVTLSGVAANSTNLGAFNQNVIADSLTVKDAVQDLEDEFYQIPTYGLEFNINLETVRYIKGLVRGTGVFEMSILDYSSAIFASVSYAYRAFGTEATAFTTVADLASLNTAINALGAVTSYEIRVTTTFQSGFTSGLINYNLVR